MNIKKPFFIFVFFLSIFAMSAQNNCLFRINVTTEQGTCYNNCRIHVNLEDGDGQPLDISGTDLEEVKYYIIEEHTSDTSLSFSNVFSVGEGTYKAGVQAVCRQVNSPGDTTSIRLDTFATVTATTSYVTPRLSVVINSPSTATAFGTVPTLPCENTGRVQLKITGGTFPYCVEVRDASQNPIDTLVFPGRMYSGEYPGEYDYKDYYSIEGLAEGKYYFLVSDGCGYVLPVVSETITTAPLPRVVQMCWYNGSGNIADSNVVKVALRISVAPGYYISRISDLIEYRIIYPELDGVVDTTGWKPLPNAIFDKKFEDHVLVRSVLYDTAWRAHSYCDIRGTIKIETRTYSCGRYIDEESFSHKFDAFKLVFFGGLNTDSTIVIDGTADCYTEWGRTTVKYQSQDSVYTNIINAHPDDSFCDNNSYVNSTALSGNAIWIYTTSAGDTIKTRPWGVGRNGGQAKIYREDLLPFFDPDVDNAPNIHVKLVDSKNCIVAQNSVTFYLKKIDKTTPSRDRRGNMNGLIQATSNGPAVCSDDPMLGDFTIYSSTRIPMELNDSCTIELIESPLGNLYNFTAQYIHANRQWTVIKERPDNLATITLSPNTRSVRIWEYGLPSGFYVFRTTIPCAEPVVRTVHLRFREGFRVFPSEEPRYEVTTTCGEMVIRPVAGAYTLRRPVVWQGPGSPNVQQRDSVDENSMASFRIMSGPAGFYSNETIPLGQTLRVSAPGTYRVRMYGDCNNYRDDTLYISGGNLEFEHGIAYVCDRESTEGFVRTKSVNGTSPYTYNLYSGPGMTGTLLATNQTGRFDNVPLSVGQTVSVQSTDQCMASFYIDLTVHDMEALNKSWVNGEAYGAESCEGSVVELHALNFGEGVTYRWEGPSGFTSAARDTSFFLPRGTPDGYYEVTFLGTGCHNVTDKVHVRVRPAPSVHIADNTTCCPGDTVTLTYTAGGSGDVHYTIGYTENAETTFRSYTNDSGHTYVPYSSGVFWVHNVRDDNCSYTVPEDTVHITLRTLYATSCHVSTLPDTVCPGGDATVRARSVLTPPYTLNWYADHSQNTLLKSDTVLSAADFGHFGFSGLVHDTSVYVTAQNSEYCEANPQTTFSYMNMADGQTALGCGAAWLFYDSGGADGNYHNGENVIHTFSSPDGKPITLTFNRFNVTSPDKLLVYTGDTIHPDSLLAELTGNLNVRLPAPIVSGGSSMTLWFISNPVGVSEGWKARIGSAAGAAVASARVLDSVRVQVAPTTPTPVHYNGDITLQATASGGRGAAYHHSWETSTDSTDWTAVSAETADTSLLTLGNLTESMWVRVTVEDRSPHACDERDTFIYYISIFDIRLSMTLEIDSAPPCSETRTGRLTVRNDGSMDATSVVARMRLPENCIFDDANNGWFDLGDIPAGASVTRPFVLRLSPLPSVSTAFTAKAQVWSCLYGDARPDVVYGDWDWAGLPRQADEDTAQFSSPAYDVHASVALHDTVCYLQTSFPSAKAIEGMEFPQYIHWYTDSECSHYLETDTLYTEGEISQYIRPDVTESATFYIMAGSNDRCLQAALPVRSELRLQTLPPVVVTHDVVCFGDTATLSASSDIAFPQFYEWWDTALTHIILRDTVAIGGVSQLILANLMKDTSFYATVSNRTTCPYIQEAFQRRATGDFLFGPAKNNKRTLVRYMDSIPFYDDGGTGSNHSSANQTLYHTFEAVEGAQVVLTLDYVKLLQTFSFLKIYDGGDQRAPLIGHLAETHSWEHYTYTSTSGKLYVEFQSSVFTSEGWAGNVTTTGVSLEEARASVYPAIDTATIPYQTCQSEVPLSYQGFNGIDISAPGDYVIDSVFHAATGCDSVVRLLLTVIDPASGLSCPDTVVRGLTDGETHVLIAASELGMPTTSFTPDTLFNDAPSDGRYPLGDHTVTWSAVNECGDTVTCTQCVRVLPPCNDAVDFEGNVYPAIRIGCQCWTQTNIRSAFYADGTPVENYSSYNGSDSLGALYGHLYSWYSAVRVTENDDDAVPSHTTVGSRSYVQGICPDGWWMPTIEDFEIMYSNAGESLTLVKEADTRFWVPGMEGEQPNSGFNARGGGFFNAALGRYEALMARAAFWAVDASHGAAATSAVLPANCGMETTSQQKNDKLSIRCVKDFCTH